MNENQDVTVTLQLQESVASALPAAGEGTINIVQWVSHEDRQKILARSEQLAMDWAENPDKVSQIGQDINDRIHQTLDQASRALEMSIEGSQVDKIVNEIVGILTKNKHLENGEVIANQRGIVEIIREFIQGGVDKSVAMIRAGKTVEDRLQIAHDQLEVIEDQLRTQAEVSNRNAETMVDLFHSVVKVMAIIEATAINVAKELQEVQEEIDNHGNRPDTMLRYHKLVATMDEVQKVWIDWKQKSLILTDSIATSSMSSTTGYQLASATKRVKGTAMIAARSAVIKGKAGMLHQDISDSLSRTEVKVEELFKESSQMMTDAMKATVSLATSSTLSGELIDSLVNQLEEQTRVLKGAREQGHRNMLEASKKAEAAEQRIGQALHFGSDTVTIEGGGGQRKPKGISSGERSSTDDILRNI